jgi:acetylornithine deacetylase/succinyl-diaminopimelate desuccinylase-like protein
VEVTLTGPNRDLHSGLYGGAVANPLNAMSALIAGLHDDAGRVTLGGFYDDVLPLAPGELEAWKALGDVDREMMDDLEVDALPGEAGFTTLERMWSRPTLDCNGIWGGYSGEGPKTVLPAWAKAKLSLRLVPNQEPQAVLASLRQTLQARRPAGTRIEMDVFSAEPPWLMPVDSPDLAMAKAAMEEAFEHPCALVRCGGSVPVAAAFRKHLGVDPLMMGYGLPDDRVHSPNEKLRIEHFWRGIVAGAAMMQNLREKEQAAGSA